METRPTTDTSHVRTVERDSGNCAVDMACYRGAGERLNNHRLEGGGLGSRLKAQLSVNYDSSTRKS